MDLLKSHRRKSRLSEILYIALNIVLATAVFAIIYFWQAPWLAIILVLLGKWRVLAVRPRFWSTNIVANTVDTVVGLSAVILIADASGHIATQIVLTVLYAVWLVFIKPRSKRSLVALQAGAAIFFGINALASISYAWDPVFFVAAMWVIGYTATRHVLGSYDETLTKFFSLAAALVFAEIGWIGYHWSVSYPIFGSGNIQLSQLALFTTLFCFMAERAYASSYRHGRARAVDIVMPASLALSVVVASFIISSLFGGDLL